MLANLDVEQVALGTLLCDPKAAHFIPMLEVNDFTEKNHRLIFEAIEMASQEGRFASPAVLAPQFQDSKIGDMTVAQYLGRLVTVATHRGVLGDHIRSLKEMSGRRIMTDMSTQMAKVSNSPNAPIQPFLETVVGQCDEILSGLRRQRITAHSVEELAKSSIERLRSKEKTHLLDTGLDTLNDELGGFGRGELNIIAGRPGMGKTAFALSCMRQAAKRGTSSMMFSLEMGSQALTARLLSDAVFNSQTPIPYKSIIRSQVTDWEIGRLEEASETLSGLPIKIDDQSGLTVSDIGVRVRRYLDELESHGQRLDVVWIDHLGYLRSSDRYRGNKVYEVGEMTKALRALAKELGIAVNLLCQLSRQVENREDKRPQSSDLRDSGNIEEDADSILMMYRDAYYLGRTVYDEQDKEDKRRARLEVMEHVVEVISPKTRNGGIFNRRFFCDIGSNAIRDLA